MKTITQEKWNPVWKRGLNVEITKENKGITSSNDIVSHVVEWDFARALIWYLSHAIQLRNGNDRKMMVVTMGEKKRVGEIKLLVKWNFIKNQDSILTI